MAMLDNTKFRGKRVMCHVQRSSRNRGWTCLDVLNGNSLRRVPTIVVDLNNGGDNSVQENSADIVMAIQFNLRVSFFLVLENRLKLHKKYSFTSRLQTQHNMQGVRFECTKTCGKKV
jgi:hypothetical protein